MLCDYSKLVKLYKLGEVYFRLLGTNGFHVKAEKERFTAAGSRCRQNLDDAVWSRHVSRRRPEEIEVYDSK